VGFFVKRLIHKELKQIQCNPERLEIHTAMRGMGELVMQNTRHLQEDDQE